MGKKERESLSDQIRQHILQSETARKTIAKEAKIDESVLSRFLRRERSITTDTLDRLARVLRIELKPPENKQ